MSYLTDNQEGAKQLLMGNEAIARGALEAGVHVASGYPGTPSSEIIESLATAAEERNLYVEWSTNEKVALEVAAAASFSQLRSLCAMKQVGVNVASDFLLHLGLCGTRGGMVLVSCDDPGALSSTNEGPSRNYAQMFEIPLLEPGDFQEAKDMTKWAFELSEKIKGVVMVRSVTRVSHASCTVRLGALPETEAHAQFRYEGSALNPDEGPAESVPVNEKHRLQQERLKMATKLFEQSPFNTYHGPEEPEVLIITSSAGNLYAREAINLLRAQDRVGLLKLGTTWPLPPRLLVTYLSMTDKIMIVEEVLPFLENNVKTLAAERAGEVGVKTFYGKKEGAIPTTGELNPDVVASALGAILQIDYHGMDPEYEKRVHLPSFVEVPDRGRTFCPGCPHRASFWSIHNALQLDNRKGFTCGDIGCYAMGRFPCGFNTTKTLHAMGSGVGLASGFGKLGRFDMEQPVVAVCGDSTFFHAAMPALVNAVHHQANITLIILDNSGTAMTGFQPHPGLSVNAMGDVVPKVDIAKVCQAMGAKVEIRDPFDLEETRETLNRLIDSDEGVKVLILQQECALSPTKRHARHYEMEVNEDLCLGEECGCNRLCTRIFQCPGLVWDKEKKKARIDEVLCVGCGVCASICPAGAIERKEVA
jgi:indolepyruvate ferredoxin oxidoreductase, alpha subunit